MRLTDYLDKGASLGAEAPCLTTAGRTLTYFDVQRLSWRIARALDASGIRPGDKVAILSANDPVAFACVFGISRAGAVWCPVNPRNEAAENRDLLDSFDCGCLIFQAAFAPLVAKILPDLPKLTTLVCLDGEPPGATPFDLWIGSEPAEPWQAEPAGDMVMLVGTGGTTGRPKGVMLTGRNIETMSALTLMSYPFRPRPRYLALAPLTHAAGVLCFPVMTLGGEIVIMPKPDLTEFLALIERHRVTHTFLPPTLIYMLLDHPGLAGTDLTSLQCLWYGAAPMSAARLEEALTRIGPVLGQLFGQSEAPMMISTLAPAEHFRDDGSLATERLSSAGRPTPLTTVAIMDDEGRLLGRGERGEIVVRGSLVMAGYYKNPQASAEASRHGWHHTGDIGYLDDGQLPVHRRPRQGHDHHRRLQRLLRRGRAGAPRPSRRPGLRRHRPARREMGRARHRGPPAAARPRRDRRRGAGLRQGTPRQREGPQAGRGLAGPAPLQSRQGAEARDQVAAAAQPHPAETP